MIARAAAISIVTRKRNKDGTLQAPEKKEKNYVDRDELAEIAKLPRIHFTSIPWSFYFSGLFLTALGVFLLYFIVVAQTGTLVPTKKQG